MVNTPPADFIQNHGEKAEKIADDLALDIKGRSFKKKMEWMQC